MENSSESIALIPNNLFSVEILLHNNEEEYTPLKNGKYVMLNLSIKNNILKKILNQLSLYLFFEPLKLCYIPY